MGLRDPIDTNTLYPDTSFGEVELRVVTDRAGERRVELWVCGGLSADCDDDPDRFGDMLREVRGWGRAFAEVERRLLERRGRLRRRRQQQQEAGA